MIDVWPKTRAMESFVENIRNVTLQMPPFIMAVIFHEYAHGFVANRWGDSTAKDQGRLTLNPVPHIDPVGTLLFPLINMLTAIPILIGWARPVPINPNRFRKYRPGLFWVSLAGPAMNFLLATLSALTFFAILVWVPSDFYLHEPLREMAKISVSLNFALGLFNLIPLPPLDGSKIIKRKNINIGMAARSSKLFCPTRPPESTRPCLSTVSLF